MTPHSPVQPSALDSGTPDAGSGVHGATATADGVSLPHYSAALDEIYRMRVAAAYEAALIYKLTGYRLPKTVRTDLANMRARLLRTARGEDAYLRLDGPTVQQVMDEAQMPKTLTRAQWEARDA